MDVKMKLGISIVAIGHTGTGKTHDVISVISRFKDKMNVYAFDLNAEEYYSQINNRAAGIYDFEDFLKKVENVEKSVIVFEEATIFMSKASNVKTIRKILVQKRHKRNIIIFNFHSIRSVSNFILDISDFVFLHFTTDKKEYIFKHFEDSPEMIKAYLEVQNGAKKISWFKRIISLKKKIV